MPDPHVMPFGDHLEELRRRLMFALVGLVPILVLGLWSAGVVLELVTEPVLEALASAGLPARLQATSPVESFLAWLKAGLVVTVLVGAPWVVTQFWLFIAPGLYEAERRFVYFLVPLSAVLTAASALFLYYVLLPISLFFLIQFGSGLLQASAAEAEAEPPAGVVFPGLPVLEADPPAAVVGTARVPTGSMWMVEGRDEVRVATEFGVRRLVLGGDGVIAQEYRIGEYTSLVFVLALVFAAAFQTPLVLMLLSWTGLVSHRDLARMRRPTALVCAVLGAVLTPQDPWSMVAMGGVLYVLFEFGLVLMRVVPARRVSAGLRPGRGGTDGREGEE